MRFVKPVVIAVGVFLSATVSAFIGNIKLGNFSVPCALACGGERGVINWNFVGDAFHSVVTGSSIDALDDKLKQRGEAVVALAEARLNAVLDDKIAKLNDLAEFQRNEFVSQLNAFANKAVDELDRVLQLNIAEADAKISDQQGTFLGLLTKSITTFAQVSLALAGAGVVLIYLSMITYGVIRKSDRSVMLRQAGLAASMALLAIIILALVAWGIKYYVSRSKVKDFVEAYNHSDFKNASLFAGALSLIDPSNKQYSVYKEKAFAIRDLVERPTILVRPQSMAHYAERLQNTSEDQFLLTAARDSDVETLRALILWRKSQGRLGEYYAAALSYFALKNADRLPDEQRFVLSEMAKFYLHAYLLRPLADSELIILGLNRADAASALAQSGYPFPTLSELLAEAAKHPIVKSAQIDFQRLHLYVIPKYLKLVSLHSSGPATPVAQRGNLQAQEIALADEIISAWESFTTAYPASEDARRIQYNMSGLYAVYARAVAYRRALPLVDHSLDLKSIAIGDLFSTATSVSALPISTLADLARQPCVGLPFHLGILKNIPPRDPLSRGIYERWFDSRTTASSTRRVQALDAKSKQNSDEDKLFSFEFALYYSSIPIGSAYSGCFSPSVFESLNPPIPPNPGTFGQTPRPEAIVPQQTVFYRTFRKPLPTPPPPPLGPLYGGVMSPAEAIGGRHRAILDAASLGLFSCSDKLADFDNCTGITRRTAASLLFDNFAWKGSFPIDTLKTIDSALSIRAFPIND